MQISIQFLIAVLDVAKESMSLMYARGKNLLETLLSLVENMSVHPHLDDEIAILVELMDDLTNFHEALYAIDLKACMSVWNFYTKLATDFAEHLKYLRWIFLPILATQNYAQNFAISLNEYLHFQKEISMKKPKKILNHNFPLIRSPPSYDGIWMYFIISP